MDLVRKSHPIRVLESISPNSIEGTSTLSSHTNSSDPSFPIIAIAIIGILATAFLLVSYYMFSIKCCINWQRIDIVTRFSLSRRPPNNDSLLVYSPGIEPRGLDEAVIRSIPIFQFKNGGNKKKDLGERSFCECAVCLNEFQDQESLKIIPICSHVFHIDCIDIWLQNNDNCPMCRRSISTTCPFPFEQIVAPSPTPQDPSPYTDAIVPGDEDYVVIELADTGLDNQRSFRRQQETMQLNQGESSSTQCPSISPSPRKLDQRILPNKSRKHLKMTSMGDEFINIRDKDDQFSVQPIRRSISMDSSADRQLYLAIQEILRQNRPVTEVSPAEGCSGRVRRTFFSFGHGRTSRNAIQPVCIEP